MQHGRPTTPPHTGPLRLASTAHQPMLASYPASLGTRPRWSIQTVTSARSQLGICILLLTPDGPTLWLHHVLLFGSAASVWSYNRFGDMLTSLTRVLTATPVVHFVDDYGSIQPLSHATSGFQGFGRLNSTLGFHMKQSKEQPPQQEHKIQGVYIHLTDSHVTIRPCPQRVHNIIHTIQQALDTNQLDPSLAQKLAGKCSFTTSQLFGKVGRAANRAVYDHTYTHTNINYQRPHDKASLPW